MAKTNYTVSSPTTTAGISGELNNSDNIIVQSVLNNTGDDLSIINANDDDLATITLDSGGVIKGGTIDDYGMGLVVDRGTLQDVTYAGDLDVTSSSLYIDDGFTAEALSGVSSAALTVDDANVYFENTPTLNDDTITLTGGSTLELYTTYDDYANNGDQSPPETLTFGSNLVIDQTSGTGYISSGGYDNDGASPGVSTIINEGQINVQGTSSSLYIDSQAFTNAGTLNVSGTTSTLIVDPGAFTNTGTIDIASGDTLLLGDGSGTYTTSAALGGTLNAGSGTVELDATLNNVGSTLDIGPSSGIGTFYVYYYGDVSGGVIHDAGSAFQSYYGTLNNVTYEGTLNLQSGPLYVDDEFTITGLSGAGPGAITLGSAAIDFENSKTIDDATITMTSGSTLELYTTYAAYSGNSDVSPAETLTFGSNLVIDQTSGTGYISSGGYDNDGASPGVSTIINEGQINVQGTNSSLYIDSQAFTNAGTLNVSGTTSTLIVDPGAFTNTGTIDIASGDTLLLGDGSGTYTTSAALGGTLNAGSGTVELDATLNNVGSTLDIGPSSGIGTFYVYYYGDVSGGVIHDAGSAFQSYYGTLNNVTYEGTLNLQSGPLYVDDEFTITGLSGAGPGAITLGDAGIDFEGTRTLDDATITMSSGATLDLYTTYAAFSGNGDVSPAETLTFGSSLVVDQTSGSGYLSSGGYYDYGSPSGNTSTIVNDGLVEAQGSGSTLYVDPQAFTNSNIVEAQDSGVVYFYSSVDISNLSADATYSGGDVLTGGTYEALDGASGGGTIEFNQSGGAGITTLAATVELTGASSSLTSDSDSLGSTLRDIASGGALDLSYSAVSNSQADFDSTTNSLTVDGALNLYGADMSVGSLVVDAGGVVTGVGESNGSTAENVEITGGVSNSGTIVAGVAASGNPSGAPEARFFINGSLTNTSGNVEIQGSTVVELANKAKGGQIVFENTAATEPQTLALDDGTLTTAGALATFTSTIAGFQMGDVIDLTNSNFGTETGYTFNGTTLTVTFSGSHTASLNLSGLSSSQKFLFNPDGGSGTNITLACYVRGSRIATPDGEVAIENLRVGDLVLTASGAARPVRWTGYRGIDIARHTNPGDIRPVRVSANAFGEGLPRRDLWLSPWHNVVSEGVLMPIIALVNGISVTQIDTATVEYWHVELDAHDILLAEGLPSESYLDTGNRMAFVNGGAFIEAHPDFAPKHWADTCLPLVQQGPEVVKTKARLLDILRARGVETTSDSDAHILADGRRIEPTVASPTQLSFDLPENCRDIVLVSRTFVPAHVIPENYDARELGLCVARLQIDGEDEQLERAGLSEDGWTDGAARLRSGARTVIVDLAAHGPYYRADPDERRLDRAA